MEQKRGGDRGALWSTAGSQPREVERGGKDMSIREQDVRRRAERGEGADEDRSERAPGGPQVGRRRGAEGANHIPEGMLAGLRAMVDPL